MPSAMMTTTSTTTTTSSSSASPLPAVGQRLSYGGALCTVRYVGEVAGTSGGLWLGVEWDDPTRGKHDGVHKGVRYFSCRTRTRLPHGRVAAAATPASFVRPTRPTDPPRTFLEAVRAKYASETAAGDGSGSGSGSGSSSGPVHAASGHQIVISGKVAEEVGFDKVRRQMAQIEMLRVVILDGMRVLAAGSPMTGMTPTAEQMQQIQAAIRAACPSISELDLSRNLFTRIATAANICRALPGLRGLRVDGNPRLTIDDTPDALMGAFDGVHELSADETFLSWAELGRLAAAFPSLANLSMGLNQLEHLTPPLPATAPLVTTLTVLSLEYNDFVALSDLASLAQLRALRNLHLKGCSISQVVAKTAEEATEDATATFPSLSPSFCFSPTLHYLDISYNRVATWAFVDALVDVFPGLTSLRFAHNPIYDSPNMDTENEAAAAATTATTTTAAAASTEESFMIAVGRLARLKTLNFSNITVADRANAEMFYLSRIAKQMAAVPEGAAEARVIARHRRFAELCTLYGEPTIVRHAAINPAFLDARLVSVVFHMASEGLPFGQDDTTVTSKQNSIRKAQIPMSFDMYAVKSLAGRLFGRSPQRLRLVWETGEWDPVAGVDGEVEDEEDDEDDGGGGGGGGSGDDGDDGSAEADAPDAVSGEAAGNDGAPPGRWVKREVELKDSPRQFGFCVDGMETRIRVELR